MNYMIAGIAGIAGGAVGGIIGAGLSLCNSKGSPVSQNTLIGVMGALNGIAVFMFNNRFTETLTDTRKTLDYYTDYQVFNNDYGNIYLSNCEGGLNYTKGITFPDQQAFDRFKHNVNTLNQTMTTGPIYIKCTKKDNLPVHMVNDLTSGEWGCKYWEPEEIISFPDLQLCPEISFTHVLPNGHITCWFEGIVIIGYSVGPECSFN